MKQRELLIICFIVFVSLELKALTRNQFLSFFDRESIRSVYYDDAINSINATELKENLYRLASEEFEGRGSGYPGDDLAASFIIDKFKSYDVYAAYIGTYKQKFSISAGRGYTWNVIGIIPGNDRNLRKELVVIGAHYDHLGKKNGKTYYGADDNGSGTASLIEVAEALSIIRNELKRTVVFIAFSAEEMGLIGSTYYVNNPWGTLDSVVFMLNLDMVGYLRQNGRLYFKGGSASSKLETIIKSMSAEYPEVNTSLTSSAGGGSDHVPFIQKGIPSVFMHTGTHQYYHSPQDTPDKIDYDGLETISKIAFRIIYYVATNINIRKEELGLPILNKDVFFDHGIEAFKFK